ncbi:MAG: hypothetical protein J6U38_08320 [Clostridia bacterium]|nr:hypothetical protein [Clostridia bacterium]
MSGRRTIIAAVLAVLAVILSAALAGCSGDGKNGEKVMKYDDNYENTAAVALPLTQATDNLGRKILNTVTMPAEREDKAVGIFYFLWLGEHGNKKLYDNSIIEKVPGATDSVWDWMNSGGGDVHEWHFWGKPMYGYYFSSDEWIFRKHVQLLTDAGIDFLVFDTTNASIYANNALKLMAILHEYRQQGYDTPQVAFYTNSDSGRTMEKIYREVYLAHPEYEDTWFYRDGKPLIIGYPYDAELSDEGREFFRIKESQWPTDAFKKEDGFPWMEFSRLYTDLAVYGTKGRKEVVNVSVAQHCTTIAFSNTAWYGGNDHSRSWHNGANDPDPDAYVYGYNLAEQFEWALKVDPEMIFITGWNEWVAMRLEDSIVRFCDNANANNSRDIEPMEGGYSDNYYMQMISFIRRYKGIPEGVPATVKTIDIEDGFSQWNDVESVYLDYEGDTPDREWYGYGGNFYEDRSGRNDIAEMKVCEDAGSVYFFVKTVDDITEPEGGNWMNLFIGTYGKGPNGFDYVLNYKEPEGGGAYVARTGLTEDGTVTIHAGKAEFRRSGNMMQVRIPKAVLGITGSAKITFKWADNCDLDDPQGFYKTGDPAPIGRAGYCYGY